mgnify:CR=1 FL=1|jgi:hypothetical protein
MRAHMINRKMQNDFINDVVERFCSLWVLIIDDQLMFSASRVEKSRCDFSNHFNHHGSHFRTLDTVIFFNTSLNVIKIDDVRIINVINDVIRIRRSKMCGAVYLWRLSWEMSEGKLEKQQLPWMFCVKHLRREFWLRPILQKSRF